jgi:hypothetical protein
VGGAAVESFAGGGGGLGWGAEPGVVFEGVAQSVEQVRSADRYERRSVRDGAEVGRRGGADGWEGASGWPDVQGTGCVGGEVGVAFDVEQVLVVGPVVVSTERDKVPAAWLVCPHGSSSDLRPYLI